MAECSCNFVIQITSTLGGVVSYLNASLVVEFKYIICHYGAPHTCMIQTDMSGLDLEAWKWVYERERTSVALHFSNIDFNYFCVILSWFPDVMKMMKLYISVVDYSIIMTWLGFISCSSLHVALINTSLSDSFTVNTTKNYFALRSMG